MVDVAAGLVSIRPPALQELGDFAPLPPLREATALSFLQFITFARIAAACGESAVGGRAPLIPLRKDPHDPALFYGAALLHADQPVATRVTIAFSSKAWQHFVLDSTGVATPPIPRNNDFYTSLGPSIRDRNPAFEKDGKTFLVINGEPWGEFEYQAVAMTRAGGLKARAGHLPRPDHGHQPE